MRTRPVAAVLAALVAVAVVVPAFAGAAVASHDGDPRFETDVPEPVLTPGTTQQLTVEVTNDAAAYDHGVERALDVSARVGSVAGIEVLSGGRELGDMGEETTRTLTVRVDVPADIPAGTHEIPIVIEYRDVDDEDELVTQTVTATVRVRERARFAVRSVESAAPVGGSGTVSVTVANVGSETAHDAVVQFSSANSDLTFGRAATARRFLGELAPGEARTVAVDATLVDSAETREYAVDATVEYETPGGTRQASRRLSFGVTPAPEQTFATGNLRSTLRVGEEGTLRGRVRNTGERRVENAVVRLSVDTPNVAVLEPTVAVGDIAPGETVGFAFDVEVSDAAEPGTRQFSLSVEYRDTEGQKRVSDPIDATVEIAEPREEFGVSGLDTRFEAGGTGVLRLEVTNNREESVTDVAAKLYLDSPLSSGDDEGFIDELGPGETATLVFDLSVAADALAGKTYPAKVDFQYETADGDTLISDTYRVPVVATEPSGDGLPVPPPVLVVGAVVVVALGGGIVYLRRR